MLRVDFVTLFPEMVLSAVDHSILKRTRESGLACFGAVNPRDFTTDPHRTVDDSPYGGGPGMVMKVEPIVRACQSISVEALGAEALKASRTAVILTDPTGVPFTQAAADELAQMQRVVLLCGHYEGIDDRVRQMLATHVFSIGDFVLTGGELPALVMADAIVRLLPGALGSDESLASDSHSDGLLSAPQFTRPESFQGFQVPKVLLSGDHQAIRNWRRKQAVVLTRALRPDLLARADLDKSDLDMLSS